MDVVRQIEELIAPAARSLGYRVVRVAFGGGRRGRLQIMAERADGTMAVADCERLSREVSPLLDVADLIAGDYVLEVSSPGIDRPLVSREDFARFAGHDARVETAIQIDGRRRFTGPVSAVDDEDFVTVETADGLARVPFAAIAKAKLILTDALLAAHARDAATTE